MKNSRYQYEIFYVCTIPDRSPIVVETQERVTEYVAVTIRKVHKNVDSTEVRKAGVCII